MPDSPMMAAGRPSANAAAVRQRKGVRAVESWNCFGLAGREWRRPIAWALAFAALAGSAAGLAPTPAPNLLAVASQPPPLPPLPSAAPPAPPPREIVDPAVRPAAGPPTLPPPEEEAPPPAPPKLVPPPKLQLPAAPAKGKEGPGMIRPAAAENPPSLPPPPKPLPTAPPMLPKPPAAAPAKPADKPAPPAIPKPAAPAPAMPKPAEKPAPPPAPKPASIELAAAPALGRPGTPWVAVAIVRDAERKPLGEVAVEWTVHPDGVGRIADVAASLRKGPRQAEGRTVAASAPAAAGAPALQPGQAWCAFDTLAPGRMLVAARVVGVPLAAEATLEWSAAKLAVPPATVGWDGAPLRLAAKAANAADHQPLAGQAVRIRLAGVVAADGKDTVELRTDAAGLADLEIPPPAGPPPAGKPPIATVELLGSSWRGGPPPVLERAETTLAWRRPEFALTADVAGPTAVETWATLRIEAAAAPGAELPAEPNAPLLAALLPAGVEAVGGQGEADRVLGSLAAGKPLRTQLLLRAAAPGVQQVTLQVRRGRTVWATRTVDVSFAAPQLKLAKKTPSPWRVGEEGEIVLSVTNAGAAPARSLKLADTLPEGLRPGADTPTPADGTASWPISELAPGATREFRYRATPLRELSAVPAPARVTGPGKAQAEAAAAITAVGVPALRLRVRAVQPSAAVGGAVEFEIALENRGTGAAGDIRIEASASPNLEALAADGDLAATVAAGVLQSPAPARLAAGAALAGRWRFRARAAGEARLELRLRHAAVGGEIAVEEAILVGGQ